MVEETIVDANLNEKMIIWKQEQSLDQNLGYREFINLLKTNVLIIQKPVN